MERGTAKNRIDQENFLSDNQRLAEEVLVSALEAGVTEFCLCLGKRCAPLVWILDQQPLIPVTRWYDERSAAFYAVGRSREVDGPIAVITTSGTAAGELLPAVMEAYYAGDPLLVITADRPRQFRGSGAPQSAEQKDLFGIYTPFSQDIAIGEPCDLDKWERRHSAHLNVCFEEPRFEEWKDQGERLPTPAPIVFPKEPLPDLSLFHKWMQSVKAPLVLVSGVKEAYRSGVIDFLLQLQAPVIAEATSGLREEPQLSSLLLWRTENVWKAAERAGYSIDGILRIGRVPTLRMWRDCEEREGKIALCSLSDLPFPGVSWGETILLRSSDAWKSLQMEKYPTFHPFSIWKQQDREDRDFMERLFLEEPTSEPALLASLSEKIPDRSLVYLGNSLPIREWDLAATRDAKQFVMRASRGLNGIDGQISTFLGQARKGRENWAIIGDLTTLYDMGALWALPQKQECTIRIVVINNGGGKIFTRMPGGESLENPHTLSFAPIAAMWGLEYHRWQTIPDELPNSRAVLIEVLPDNKATQRFWDSFIRA